MSDKLTDRLAGLLFAILILILALAPLPLGSNRPLPANLIGVATGLLVAIGAALSIFNERRAPFLPVPGLRLPAILFGVTILWAFIQWMPLPFAGLSHPLWDEASSALGEPLAHRISLDPGRTLSALVNLLSYAAVFMAALWMTRKTERAQAARLWIVAIGAVYAAYGVINLAAGPGWLPGQIIASHGKSLVSTFVNRNNFATFAGLCLLCAFSVLLDRVWHILSTSRPARQKAALVIESLVLQSGIATASTLVLALALFLTASRGGIAATLCALMLLTYLRMRGSAQGGPGRFIMPLLLVIAVSIGFIAGGDRLMTRIERGGVWITEDMSRYRVFTTTAEAIASAPLTGTGLGTYEGAIELYRSNDTRLFTIWQRAHNSYLESTMELGIPAALSLHVAILLLAGICLRGLRVRRRGRSFPALGLAATLLVGLHALVDFSLQIPAVALTYAFIMGFAVAQSAPGTSRRQQKEGAASTPAPPRELLA
ncbi:MAG: O-antigen ligase family protein [Parvibaculum sp.]|nr:O-antigen ligase family protein [Parvibaculum sp.]